MDVLTRVDHSRIAALRHRDQFFWLDLDSPADGELDALGELLGVHPLALEDTREFGQRPKVDAYGDDRLAMAPLVARTGPSACGRDRARVIVRCRAKLRGWRQARLAGVQHDR